MAIVPSKLAPRTLGTLQAFVLDNPRFGPINTMSTREAKDGFLMWNGIMGYTDHIVEAFNDIDKADAMRCEAPRLPNGSVDVSQLAEQALEKAIQHIQACLGVKTGDLAAEHFQEEFAHRQLMAYIVNEIDEARGL